MDAAATAQARNPIMVCSSKLCHCLQFRDAQSRVASRGARPDGAGCGAVSGNENRYPRPMSWTRRYEDAEPQRVNRWLAQSGVCSRREAEALIAQGLVTIDGERVEDVGRKILPGQTLTLADRGGAGPFTAVLNKPPGFVSGQPEPGYTPAVRLLTREAL